MGDVEQHIIEKAHEFDRTDDWPQPFSAFVAGGHDEAETRTVIREMAHAGRLTIGHFHAEQSDADAVLGLGHAR